MAKVSDWSPVEEKNVNLDQLSLSNEQGLYWNKIMAALRRWRDDVDSVLRRLDGSFVYKGTVPTLDDLPTEGVEVGDVYSVISEGGENYAWTERGWAPLGSFNADVVHRKGDETIEGTKTFTEPIEGSVTGTAETAGEFTEAKAVTLTGDVSGTASSRAGWTVSTTLATSGVTAGTYGPEEDASPEAEASFVVPCFTVDAKGRVTAVVERTITLPPDTVSEYDDFEGATSLADGERGLVPKPYAADVDKLLGAGGWRYLVAADITAGTLQLDRIPNLDAGRIPNLDASKITTGTIDVARLPAAALERLVVVADQAARYALTDLDVQLGDVVKQTDMGLLYYVVDTDELDNASGYVEFTAGSAASVPWSGVTSKPTTISGYGITDAKIDSGSIVLGANTLPPITNAQIAALFENDSISPDDPPMSHPERAVLCGDGVWRYFEQIAF